jgi:hypothetical protein
MAMVDEKWGRNQQVAAYDSFAILRPTGWGGRCPGCLVSDPGGIGSGVTLRLQQIVS